MLSDLPIGLAEYLDSATSCPFSGPLPCVCAKVMVGFVFQTYLIT